MNEWMGKDSSRERETSRNDSGIDEEKQKNRAEKESEDDSWGNDAGAANYELASSSTIVWMPPQHRLVQPRSSCSAHSCNKKKKWDTMVSVAMRIERHKGIKAKKRKVRKVTMARAIQSAVAVDAEETIAHAYWLLSSTVGPGTDRRVSHGPVIGPVSFAILAGTKRLWETVEKIKEWEFELFTVDN